MSGVAVVFSTVALVQSFKNSAEISKLDERIGDLETLIKNLESELENLKQSQVTNNELVFNILKFWGTFRDFETAFDQNNVIPTSVFDLFNVSSLLTNLKNPVLDSCKFYPKETPGVWALEMEFTASRVNPELKFLEAEQFPSLMEGSSNCTIGYPGPKQIIYNVNDRTYCKYISPFENHVPYLQFPTSVIQIDRQSCLKRKSIDELYEQLSLSVGCFESSVKIDPESLVKVRRMGKAGILVQCAGLKYVYDGEELTCPGRVFLVPGGKAVYV